MVCIVEMGRGEPNTPGYENYSCSGDTWRQLLNLAQTYGWDPKGTLPDEHSARYTENYEKYFEPNYEPREWSHCKRVDTADADELATSLVIAKMAIDAGEEKIVFERGPILIGDSLTFAEMARINANPVDLINSFAKFLYDGGFRFAWDD